MNEYHGIGVVLEGVDGSRWDLRRDDVRLTDSGIEGLGRMEIAAFVLEHAFVDGQEFAGWRGKARSVFLPLLVGVSTTNHLAWQLLDRRLHAAVHPGKYNRLIVTAADNQVRELRMRFERDTAAALTVDPSLEAWDLAGFRFTADDPWWYGQEESWTFSHGAPQSFYGPTGFGPPFYLAPSTFTGEEVVSNHGDDDAWPVWEQDGPYDAFHFEVGGRVVSSAEAIPEGFTFVLDTHPTVQAAYLIDQATGARELVDEYLEDYDFARIPAGEQVPITVLVSGTGDTRLRIRPRYFKAW